MARKANKAASKLSNNNERDARRGMLNELFYDLNRSKSQIYWTNFFRGIFFGVGSVIGGTLIIALVLWVLSWLVDIPGGVGDFVKFIVDTVRQR